MEVKKIYKIDEKTGKRMRGRPSIERTQVTKNIGQHLITANIPVAEAVPVKATIIDVPENTKKAYSERNIEIGTFSFTETVEREDLSPDTLEKFYLQNEIVSACVDVTSFAVAGAGYHFRPYLTEKELPYNHRVILQRMFDDINEDDESDDLIVETAMDLLTYGDAYWERVVNYKVLADFVKYLKNPEGDPWSVALPYKFYKVSAKWMRPVTNKEKTQIVGYEQVAGTPGGIAGAPGHDNVIATWKEPSIIHFRMPVPSDTVNGMPPSGVLSNQIAADIFATDYNGKFFQNNATPRLHIDLGNVSKEELAKFCANASKELKGQPHKNLVTRGGVKVEPIALKNSDMEFSSYQENIGQKIMAKYRVPPMILGFLKSTSSMSAEAQIALFKFLAVSPVRKIIAGRINKKIVRALFPGVKACFEFNPVDRLDLVQQSEVDTRDVQANIKTVNEIRAERGLDAVAYGDQPIAMPGQNIPGQGGVPASKVPVKSPKGSKGGKQGNKELQDGANQLE